MAAVIKDIKLDFLEENNVVVLAKQEDAGSRFIRVTFAEEGKPFAIAGASYVTLNVKKNDGHVVTSEGIVNDDGTATVPLISQMLAVDGDAKADVSVFGIAPEKLTTMSFTIRVQESSVPDGTEISTDEFNDLITALAEVAGFAGVRDEVEDARGTYGTVGERLDTDITSLKQQLADANKVIANMSDGRITVDGGYGNISDLPKTAAVAAMNSILYGMTATNLVANGYAFTNTEGWSTGVSARITNGEIELYEITLATPNIRWLNGKGKSGDKIYMRAIARGNADTTSIAMRYRDFDASLKINGKTATTGLTTNQSISDIVTLTSNSDAGGIQVVFYHNTTPANSCFLNTALMVNLTAQGEDTLTLAQLDAKYANYFSGTQSAQVTCIESRDKDGKITGEQYIEPYNLYRTPNNAACKIDTANNEYVPSVKKYVLKANDIFTITTTIENNNMANISLDVMPDVDEYGVEDIQGIKAITDKTMPRRGAGLTSPDVVWRHDFRPTSFRIIAPKDVFPTLEAAQALLAGTVIYYQLSDDAVKANTIKNVVTGNILSRPNGTIQFSNKHSFTSMVVDGKLPTRTNYADIATVERLEKLNTDGTLTPLDISTATIAADKRSISHPQLANGAIARCKYAYTFGGVNGRKDISYVTGQNLVTDSVTGKVYKVGKAIANGVMTDTMTEVV